MRRTGARAAGGALLAFLAPLAWGHERATDTVTGKVGERFSIRLDANPTTGYRWRLATAPDPHVATLVGSTYEANDGGRTGAGGEETWTFVARGPGRTHIVFEYLRPWETAEPAIRRHAVHVTVRPAEGPRPPD